MKIKLIRQSIYFLLITLVINAGGWTFNKEAVADVLFDEQYCQAVGDDRSSAEPEDTKTVSSKIPCNHWCHTIGHQQLALCRVRQAGDCVARDASVGIVRGQ